MNRTKNAVTGILALVLLLTAMLAWGAAAEGSRAEHEAIVSFRPEAASDTADLERILAESLDGEYELISPMWVDDDLVLGLVRCPARSAEELVALLSANENIVYAQENRICLPLGYDSQGRYDYDLDDPLTPYQYYLNPPAAVNLNTAVGNTRTQGLPEDQVISLRACGLWEESSDDIVVAVIDTGVNAAHEDLEPVMWHNPGNIGLPGESGYNYLEDTPDLKDVIGHGTHVSGVIAAAANNRKGIAGIAAGADVRIMVLATNLFGEDSEAKNEYCFLQSMNYILQAKRAGVNIVAVNNSWSAGAAYLYDALLAKMSEEGIVNFIAAGNDAVDMEHQKSGLSESDTFGTVVVGACDIAGNPAGFTNYGKTSVDIFAPGVNILSTYGGSSYLPNLMTPELLSETTEYYGRFDPGMACSTGKIRSGDGDTVTPVTGRAGQSPKPFGSLQFQVEKSGMEGAESGQSGEAYLELSLSPDVSFTTGATLEVTICNPQEGEKYYIWFPYAKNPATDSSGNTLLSILGFRGYREGDSASVVYGGEILVETDENGERQCSVVADGTFQFGNGSMDSGVSMHVHYDVGCITGGTQILLGADELAPGQEVGLGFRIDAGETKRLPGSPENAPIHIYIDSLGISIPGMNDQAAPVNGGYEIMSGTSMASPAAAASYALLASQHPRKAGQSGTDYVREMLALFLSSATYRDALKDLCSTGGYVDLYRTEKEYPAISAAVSDMEAGTLTLYGRNLTETYSLGVRNLMTGAVTDLPAAGMTLEYAEDGKSLVIRGARTLFNTGSEFILSKGNDVLARKAYYLVRGQDAPELVYSGSTDGHDIGLLTDSAGEALYACNIYNGTISVWDGSSFVPRNNTGLLDAMRARLKSEGWTDEQLESTEREIKAMSFSYDLRVPAAMDNRIYDFIQVLDYAAPEGTRSWYYIASMDYTAPSPEWEIREAAGYPGPVTVPGHDNWYDPTYIAAADGNLYLFGDVPDIPSPFTFVYCYNLETGVWTRGSDLAGTALSYPYILEDDGKLWIVFASENDEQFMSRRVYSYDRSGWTALKELPFAGRHFVQDTPEFGRILAGCTPLEYGLFMANCSTEGGGSFFVYDPETGECLPLYLSLRDGRSDALTASAVMAGGSVYTLVQTQGIEDGAYIASLYRIPYRNLYRTAPAYYHVIGDSAPVVITAKRTTVDWLTWERFRRLTVDGVPVDPKYYRTERGSLVLTLSPEYLDTLPAGEHPAVLSFADGTAETTIVISKPVPKAGDDASPGAWIACICLGLAMPTFLFRRNHTP